MARTLILGAGFGGITVASELRRLLGDQHEVVLVDRNERFVMGLRKLWEPVRLGTLAEGSRSRRLLEGGGVTFLQRTVTAIDPRTRRVATAEGELSGDHLVVALGAEPRPDLVPGLVEHGHDLWNPAGVPAFRDALAAFDGGRIAVVVTGVPYPCPPAPFECAMLLDDHLRERGLRERSELVVATLQPILLPNAGPEGSRWLGEQLSACGVAFHTGRKVQRVEAGKVVFADGDLPFDLLVGVPPHRVPAVVRESGLTGDGDFVSVDPATFATPHPGVFAIGDVTKIVLANGLALPKAGLMAELEGTRVAAAIAAELRGEAEPPGFDGRGSCFIEMGKGVAAMVQGDFYATPQPRVEVTDVSTELAESKRRFELERLARWFGR